MNHKFTTIIAMMTATLLFWISNNLQISQNAVAISGLAGFIVSFFAAVLFYKSIKYSNLRGVMVDDEEWEHECRVSEHLDCMRSMYNMGRFFLLALVAVLFMGCSGKIMYIEYGLDRMAGSDKAKLNEVLSTAPDGRRVSWSNKASNSQYTITPTDTYRMAGGQAADGTPIQRTCREYLIDDVYPYNAHPRNRGHRQLREHACWDPHQGRWYAITTMEARPFIQFGGPVYSNYRRN